MTLEELRVFCKKEQAHAEQCKTEALRKTPPCYDSYYTATGRAAAFKEILIIFPRPTI